MKNLFKIVLLTMVAIVAGACDKEDEERMIWDFINYTVDFAVEDATAGADLLDPASEGNILNQEIKVIYNGKEYSRYTEPDLEIISMTTRDSFVRPFALRWGKREYTNSYWVTFGEFDPTEELHQERFVIDWGDGTQNEIVLDCYITWKGNDPTVHRALWVDGVAQGDDWRVFLKK